MTFPRRPLKLIDCEKHGLESGAELFVVEGDSAASSVENVRDSRVQAVLPMQGKPLNALRATKEKLVANPHFKMLVNTLGAGLGMHFEPKRLRYERIVLLMDPDADGIHCGVLMLMFFYRWLRPLLDAGRVQMVHAPVGQIQCEGFGKPRFAYTDAEFRAPQSVGSGVEQKFTKLRYRGLASIDLGVLSKTCVHPTTRLVSILSSGDAERAIELFGYGVTGQISALGIENENKNKNGTRQGLFSFY